jgi:ribosome-associated toxin RatA of RatAB toxin-antitoxin module
VEGFFVVDDAHEVGKVGGRGPAAPELEFKLRILSNGIMAVVHKSVLLAYSAEQMFALVDRVEDYPAFLPWCGGVEIRERAPDQLVAAIQINFRGIRQSFTTRNTHLPPTMMQMTLVEGPFSHLDGQWHFKALRDDACKVEFDLHYEFSSKLLEKLIGPVFSTIADSFVESFCKRAEVVYG